MQDDQTTEIAMKPSQPSEDSFSPTYGVTLSKLLKNPLKRQLIEQAKQMLAENTSHRQINKELGLSRQTIAHIQKVYAEQIGTTFKEHAAFRAGNILNMSLDALEAQLEAHMNGTGKEIPAGTMSLIGCQWADKKLQLEGEATSRQEVVHTHNTLPLQELYDSLPQARKADPAPIDIDSPKPD